MRCFCNIVVPSLSMGYIVVGLMDPFSNILYLVCEVVEGEVWGV